MTNKRERIAVVTGASRGIGAYLAAELWDMADIIVICARELSGLLKTAGEIEKRGGRAHPMALDLCLESDQEKLLDGVRALGDLDIVIHNAGIEMAMAFERQSEAQVRKQLELNTMVPLVLTHRILPLMRERDAGRMVFISSMSGKSPTPFNSVYSASKYALNGFVASLALELKGSGIHVGTVCPSFVADAGMWADTGVKAPALMKEVPLSKVLSAVRRVLAAEATEVLVTPSPIRPLLALYALFPSLGPWLLQKLGVWAVLEHREQVALRQHMDSEDH